MRPQPATTTSADSIARRARRTLISLDLSAPADPPGPPDSGGVDNPKRAPVPGEHRIHRVTSGSGHLADDHPLFPK